ncbi:unnamed protein product [Cylicocyclus nassatus]|uniref:Uncharacterized protein n=1 Tax=Cylicocyclus nassatus TaxID=53992 RepID=A0AA36MDA3_CYLNA|nr:unnamed protein product [Cylicocyclus nassatus]
MMGRDERLRLMTCLFEEITESEEEEDNQILERISPEGHSPFAVIDESPFAERRVASPQNRSPTYARKLGAPRLCRGLSDPGLRRPEVSTMLETSSPDLRDNGSALLTLPPIPETASF